MERILFLSYPLLPNGPPLILPGWTDAGILALRVFKRRCCHTGKYDAVTGASMEQFMSFLRPEGGNGGMPEGALPAQAGSIPLLGFAQAGAGGFFDDSGFPAGQGWD